jgi:hypothetical protein
MRRSTAVLTENQRSLLAVCLEIARDKFGDNAKYLRTVSASMGLADQFEKQEKETKHLLSLFATADEVAITEEL